MSFLSKLVKGVTRVGAGLLTGGTSELLNIGGSLLGGVMQDSSSRAAANYQNWYNDPAQIRARAEAAGFNPLSFIGPGVGNMAAPAATGALGAAVQNSAAIMAQRLAEAPEADARLTQIELQNEVLRKQLEQSLRPAVGGIFAQQKSANVASTPSGVEGFSGYTPVVALADGVKHQEAMTMARPYPKPVNLRNAITGDWKTIDGKLARQLEKNEGDWWVAEDGETVYGDVIGEAQILGEISQEVASKGTGAFGHTAFSNWPRPESLGAKVPEVRRRRATGVRAMGQRSNER